MYLTGDPEGPPLAIVWDEDRRLDSLFSRFGVDAAVLGERAGAALLGRGGQLSCSRRTRLMPARDGWVALSLARTEDLELLPALLGIDVSDLEVAWGKVAPEVESRSVAELDEQAGLLGLCLSVVGGATGPLMASGGPRPGAQLRRAPLVVDLSALWAGPLAAQLLRRSGARVVKVEDVSRPDGARGAAGQFFDLVNEHKLSVALDFRTPVGRSHLLDLLSAADVIVTSSRARAFDQLDIAVDDVLCTSSDKVWTAITGYGWSSNRVGYGDDVAAGAGLVAWHPVDEEPRFAADAIADPLCGVEAAAMTLDCLARGGRWFVDASLAGAALEVKPQQAPAQTAQLQEGIWYFGGRPVEAPRARAPQAPARPFGSDTDKVLASLR
jgi:CoA-transferase family III